MIHQRVGYNYYFAPSLITSFVCLTEKMEQPVTVGRLYVPRKPPETLSTEKLKTLSVKEDISLDDVETVALILGCTSEQVELIDQNFSFIAFSVADYGGGVNQDAIKALAELSAYPYLDLGKEHALRGPILIIHQE